MLVQGTRSRFQGSYVALPTPFRKGEVDYASLEHLIEWHIESGSDGLVLAGILRFPTFNPISATSSGDACANASKCSSSAGTSRLYQTYYNTGNAYLGASDRGQTQTSAMFITAETAYLSGGSIGSHGLFWSGGLVNPPLGVGRKITVRSWKEKPSNP